MFRITLALILIALTWGSARADDATSRVTRVELRSTVRLADTHTALTLGDLARIEGVQAPRLRALPIVTGGAIERGAWSLIAHDDIRAQMKAGAGINMGGIELAGPDVRITRIAPRAQRQAKPSTPEPESAPDETSLRRQLERWINARLKVRPEQSRLRFQDRDAGVLDRSTAGQIVEVREIARSKGLVLSVTLYQNERIVLDQSFRVEVLIERPVRVTIAPIRRSTPVSDLNSRIERRWVPLGEPAADPERSLGLITVSTIEEGRMILAGSLEAPILIERGQDVSARSIAGTVSVSMIARAKQSGRLGDIIELESKDRKQQFQARVAGPGQAVILRPTTNTPPPHRRSGATP